MKKNFYVTKFIFNQTKSIYEPIYPSLLFYSFSYIDTYVKNEFNSKKTYTTYSENNNYFLIKCVDNNELFFHIVEN